MKKVLKMTITVFSLILLINGFFVLMMSNFTIGNLLCIAIGAMLLIVSVDEYALPHLLHNRFYKVARVCTIVFCVVLIVGTVFLNIYGSYDNCTYDEDAVIVLGAAVRGKNVSAPLAYRLDSAIEYHKKNPDALIIVSGGKGYQEDVSEAEAMKDYLIQKGIDESIVICENKSTSTYENFVFSKKILDKHFKRSYTVTLITNDFHVFRASRIAKEAGLSPTHAGAYIQWYNIAPNGFRECLAVAKNFVFGG